MESNLCSPCSWEPMNGTDHETQKSSPYPSHFLLLKDPVWHYRSTQFPFTLISKITRKWKLDILRKLSLITEELGWKKTNLNKSEIRVNVEKNSGNSIVTSIFVASILVSSTGTVFKAGAIHKTPSPDQVSVLANAWKQMTVTQKGDVSGTDIPVPTSL